MGFLLRFFILASLKIGARLFYRFEVTWVGNPPPRPFDNIRIGMVLNHTSLFEPLYLACLPWSFTRDIAKKGVFPGADKTMNRPIAGKIFRLIAPKVITVSRQRDNTWSAFIDAIDPNCVVLITPEARMKRRTGLDSAGRPMTVRAGIVEILEKFKEGRMCVLYSGGLHHVQAPGEGFPKLFKTIKCTLEAFDIDKYLASFSHITDHRLFRQAIIKDLERRRDEFRPRADNTP